MPRTKVNRVAGNKRLRENTAELEELLRDYEIEVENNIQMLQSEHNKELRAIDSKFDEIKRSIPAHILSMKLSEVRKLIDFNDIHIEDKMTNLNVTVKETLQKADEGYLTEFSDKSRMTSGSESAANKSLFQNVSTVGTLKKTKTKRRSKSVSSMTTTITPGPRAMMSSVKGRTPLAQQQQPGQHASRSKYRTPLGGVRQKAMSVDRMNTITPKVNPGTPLSMMRHARAGEAIFSMTGSPIVPSNVTEQTANINIPVADGILSIRPEAMLPSNLDPTIVGKIDQHTIIHLRTLHKNLDILMAGFNRRFKN